MKSKILSVEGVLVSDVNVKHNGRLIPNATVANMAHLYMMSLEESINPQRLTRVNNKIFRTVSRYPVSILIEKCKSQGIWDGVTGVLS